MKRKEKVVSVTAFSFLKKTKRQSKKVQDILKNRVYSLFNLENVCYNGTYYNYCKENRRFSA